MAGKSSEELKSLTPQIIEELLDGLEPASKHAAVLCVDAAKRLADCGKGLGANEHRSGTKK